MAEDDKYSKHPESQDHLPTRPARSSSLRPRNASYAFSPNINNLNEVGAPAPIDNPGEGPTYHSVTIEDGSSTSRRSSPPTDISAILRTRSDESSEDNSLPNEYQNLAEVASPPPVENPDESSSHRHEILEQERSRSGNAPWVKREKHQPSQLSQPSSSVTALPAVSSKPKELQNGIPPGAEAPAPGGPLNRRVSRFATELYTVSFLIIFSILGTLARLGMQWLTFYPGAPVVFPNLWANFAGTLVMGFLAEDQHLFRDATGKLAALDEERAGDKNNNASASTHAILKKRIPLFIGLATGFCGSFTSFSSFMRDVFFALENGLPSPINHPYPPGASINTTSTVPRNGGYSFMALCAVIILTLAVCHAALKLGAHLAIMIRPFTPSLPYNWLRKIIDRAAVFLAIGMWLGAIFMAIFPPDRPGGPASKGSWARETWRGQAVFACVFAPLGCLLRFYVSLKLNGMVASFPLGTSAVNILGTAILGMAFDLQHVRIGSSALAGGGRVPCQVLQGIMDGFCGCLTTVSTWMVELNGLRRRHAYIYGGVSVLTALGILVLVMGSVRWSVGYMEPACTV